MDIYFKLSALDMEARMSQEGQDSTLAKES